MPTLRQRPALINLQRLWECCFCKFPEHSETISDIYKMLDELPNICEKIFHEQCIQSFVHNFGRMFWVCSLFMQFSYY